MGDRKSRGKDVRATKGERPALCGTKGNENRWMDLEQSKKIMQELVKCLYCDTEMIAF